MQASAFHWADQPDVGPKLFSGHGSTAVVDPTGVHTDLADAANMCVFATPMSESEVTELRDMAGYNFDTTTRKGQDREPGALWHLFHRDVYADVVRYVFVY